MPSEAAAQHESRDVLIMSDDHPRQLGAVRANRIVPPAAVVHSLHVADEANVDVRLTEGVANIRAAHLAILVQQEAAWFRRSGVAATVLVASPRFEARRMGADIERCRQVWKIVR